MPPRHSTGSASIKRDRSTSSPLSSDHVIKSTNPPSTKSSQPVKPKKELKETKANDDNDAIAPPPKKPRVAKGKAWPPVDLDPSIHPPRQGHSPIFTFPPATTSTNGALTPATDKERPILLGAHVSMAGGPGAALLRAGLAGANAVALFLKGHRQWKAKDFEPEAIERFKELVKSLDYPPESILVHGNYLINLCNPDPVKWDQSYECFKDDIYRCYQLGIKLYNWHPGSTVGACTKEESFALLAKAINRVHKEVPEVICVIENMANAGSNIVGTAFSDLSSIIALVQDKTRVKICLDTCHTFAAGYDIRTSEKYNQTMKEFDEVVGMKYLGGIHLNDSKMDLGGHKDLHENIGLGKIGLTGFRALMRDPRMSGIPIILETPSPSKSIATTDAGELMIWTQEINLLYEIQAVSDDEWAKEGVVEGIEKRWRKERDALRPPEEKGAKGKGGKKGKKGGDEDDSDDE